MLDLREEANEAFEKFEHQRGFQALPPLFSLRTMLCRLFEGRVLDHERNFLECSPFLKKACVKAPE
jgi:hypothetical protein